MTDKTQKPVALVLGAAVRPGGVASPALERRTRHAITLWQQSKVSALVLSGGQKTHPPAEALVMAELCHAAGVPSRVLHIEPSALTTEDNFRCSRPLLDALAPPKVIVVTDRYHARRARLVARRQGLVVRVSSPDLIDVRRWRIVRAWAREMIALAWYWINGKGR